MFAKRFIPPLLGALMLAVLAFGLVDHATPVASYSNSPLFPSPSLQSQTALRYLAKNSGLPTSNFVIMNEYVRKFPLMDRYFKAFVIWDENAGETIDLLVDFATGEVIVDIAALEEDEAALQGDDGKLHPDLFSQMQESKDGTQLLVGIWIEYDTKTLDNNVLYDLAIRHPEVLDAIYSGAGPFAVDDALLQQLQQEYAELWNAKVEALALGLAAELRSNGFDPEVTSLLPSVKVMLTKDEIEDLASRSDVQAIVLGDSLVVPDAEPQIVGNLPYINLAAD